MGEYWIVDPREREVRALVLDEGRFRDEPVVGEGATIESRVVSGFRIAVADIFAD